MTALSALRLQADALYILDQRALPFEQLWLRCTTVEDVAVAIETLAVRGAPAIGGAAACALVLAVRTGMPLPLADARLRRTRPTAVNLFAALDAVGVALDVRAAAAAWLAKDAEMCAALGRHGAALLSDGDVVITICHTGALATCGQGTALGCIRSARAAGKDVRVVALETRPLLQGARLTTWECEQLQIPCTLITDAMSAHAIDTLGVSKAMVGADRIAADGSVANKIGTRTLATVCAAHEVPFYVVAPTTTIDTNAANGAAIVVEQRAADEVRSVRGSPICGAQVAVFNPAFDVTPPHLIGAIVTERGVLRAPFIFAA